MVQRICSCGGSTLELPDREHEVIQTVLHKIPKGLGKKGLYVIERKGTKGNEVLVYSFSGSRFNGLLCVLLQDRIGGRVQVKYNDFTIRVNRAGKEGGGERILQALKEIQDMGMDEIRKVLPVPRADEWKFSRALPLNLLSDLSLSDHYHVEDFMNNIKSEHLIMLNSDH
jgi:hypothetical protein